jgi:hypothetical protein
LPTASLDWKNMLIQVVPGLFPPHLVVQVEALACNRQRPTGAITAVGFFPRDPDFATKARRVLDLYARQWQGIR